MSGGREALKLVDLSLPLTRDAIDTARESLRRFGAIRVDASQVPKHDCQEAFSEANKFFKGPAADKKLTLGYSSFRSERVRRKIAIPKESLYLFSNAAHPGYIRPPATLLRSVKVLHQHYMRFRTDHLLPALSNFAACDSLLSNYSSPEFDTLGFHHYVSGELQDFDIYFNPPHVDSGLLTVLFQLPGDRSDFLEIADLDSTTETGSRSIGEKARFEKVAFQTGEAIVLAGLQSERIFGTQNARACVHRVRRPNLQNATNRMSLAFFLHLQDKA